MTTDEIPRIFPLGNGALTVEFGRDLSVSLNESAIALANYFDANPFAGYIESAPAYASTTIFFDVPLVRRSCPDYQTAFDAVKHMVESILPMCDIATTVEGRHVEIPVRFTEVAGPDLSIVAEFSGLTEQKVVDLFLSVDYRVYMIGFLPGFPYMGEVDERIAIPRKTSPRLRVPKGSIGIGGRQTGIYPFDSPGGWQIIGRTDLYLFDPVKRNPCLLEAGDTVRFVNIDG